MGKNILFVCKYNRFRSKVAEAFFKKYNKNSRYKVRSAGAIKGLPLNPKTQLVCKSRGISIKNPPRGLSTELLNWQDITIVVADNVPRDIFSTNKKFGKKTIIWNTPDTKTMNKKDILKVVDRIENKIKRLVGGLK